MAAKSKHTLMKVGGAGVVGFLAYEFLYKPWHAAQVAAVGAAAAPTLTSTLMPFSTGGGANIGMPYITMPNMVGPTPSNLDPGAAVGGLVGTCMHIKGWTQSQCQTRITNLTNAWNAAKAQLAPLTSGQQAATWQAQIDANKAALAAAAAPYNQALASGDFAAANQWKIAIDGHNADIANLTALINSIPQRIADYQTAMANWQAQWKQITGGLVLN